MTCSIWLVNSQIDVNVLTYFLFYHDLVLVKEDDFKEVGSDEDNDYDMDVEPDNQKISHPHTVDYSLRYRGEINSFTCSSYVRG